MAKKQALVIGLGQFGMEVARSLSARGLDVLAADRRHDRVQMAAAFAADAIALDGTQESELAQLRPATRDVCICAIGDDSREASIIVTALLRQMGARHVIARASTQTHARILDLVGAHEVLNPESLLAQRLAGRFATEGALELLQVADNLVVTELIPPSSAVGRRLSELHLPRNHDLTVIAVRATTGDAGHADPPTPDRVIGPSEVLIVVGPPGAARRYREGG
jgi:trk system potassium uptake protein TrkA